MTAVEEREPAAEASFEATYAADRATLYRALVLATGNRDIAVEAIDRAFAAWQSRRSARRTDAALQVFSSAHSWAARRLRRPGRMIQGFRLQPTDVDTTDDALLAHFDDLDMADRSMLTCLHYLRWDASRAAEALGVAAGEALPRAGAAESRLARSAGTTTVEVASRLPRALDARAELLPEPLQRADQVKARARWRRLAILTGTVAGALVVVAGVGFGIQQISSTEPTDGTDATNGVGGATQGTVAPDLFAAEELVWERVPLPIRNGDINSVAFGPAGFVAVGNDYSAAAAQSVSLVSSDGVYWEIAPGPAEGPNAWVHQIILAGGRYIAIGSGFNEALGRDRPFVSVSDDGVSWVPIELPVEQQIDVNGQLMNLHTWVQSVAASGDRVIVLASQNVEFDPQVLLREALGDEAPDNWGWSNRGIEVYSDQGGIEKIIAWEDAGIDEATAALITSGRPVLYTSADLSDWDVTPVESLGPNAWFSNMTAVGDKFAAIVYGDFGPSLWVSSNGTEWEQNNAFDAGVSIQSLAGIGDRVIAVGTDADGGSFAWLSSDLEVWEPIEIPLQSGWMQQIQVSSAGIAVLAEEQGPPLGPVEIVVGDLTVQANNNGGFIVLDADGAEIARIPGSDAVYHDDMTTELLDPDTGDTLVTFDQRELNQAWEQLWREAERERGNSGPNFVLILSRDGTEWTSVPLADAIGGKFYPNAIAVGTDSIVMTGWQEGGIVEDVIGGGGGVSVWVGTMP